MDELVDVLMRLRAHAERERAAIRRLDTREMFELAVVAQSLGGRLARALERVTPADTASERWPNVRALALEAKQLSRANADVMRRSLELVRALKPPMAADERSALVSQHA